MTRHNASLAHSFFLSLTYSLTHSLHYCFFKGVAWVGDTGYFASANEGDLDGGSRGWSIIDPVQGSIVWDSGNALELEAVRVGHYPESRSENKGNEPENVFYSKFGNGKAYVFVLAERSNVVFVYDVTGENVLSPILLQTLVR